MWPFDKQFDKHFDSFMGGQAITLTHETILENNMLENNILETLLEKIYFK